MNLLLSLLLSSYLTMPDHILSDIDYTHNLVIKLYKSYIGIPDGVFILHKLYIKIACGKSLDIILCMKLL